jgi:hypothetical protein
VAGLLSKVKTGTTNFRRRKGYSAMYSKGQQVYWSGDNQLYIITVVHANTQPVTYDIKLVSNPLVTHTNVPEGDLHVADKPTG